MWDVKYNFQLQGFKKLVEILEDGLKMSAGVHPENNKRTPINFGNEIVDSGQTGNAEVLKKFEKGVPRKKQPPRPILGNTVSTASGRQEILSAYTRPLQQAMRTRQFARVNINELKRQLGLNLTSVLRNTIIQQGREQTWTPLSPPYASLKKKYGRNQTGILSGQLIRALSSKPIKKK